MGKIKDVNKQIETYLVEAQTMLNDTTVPIKERILRTADIYRQAEEFVEHGSVGDRQYESLLSDSAKFYSDYALFKEALPRYLHLITLRESLYGQDHPATATAYHDIGEVYRNLCDYSTSLEYQIKSLDIRKDVWGQKHRETAESYNDVGLLYYHLGDYEQASEFFLLAKDIREEIAGLNDPDTAESIGNIGLLYWKQEDYQKSLEYYSKALNIYEETMGEENRKTALMFYCVALMRYELKNLSEAIDYCSKAISVYEKVLGEEHHETALAYLGMGFISYSLCDLSKALEYFSKAHEINQKVFGDENINTATSYNVLGFVEHALGEREKGLAYCEKCLSIHEKILGVVHPDTAELYQNIAYMYSQQDDDEKAGEYFSKALEIYKKLSGTEFINKKIKMVEADMERLFSAQQQFSKEESTIMEEKKGTRDLFLETLTKIGCQYEIAEGEEGEINFGYQGEYFVVTASNENRFVKIYDINWSNIELYDLNEFSRLKQVVNDSNLNNSVIAVYTIDEDGNSAYLHSKSTVLFIPEIPDIEDYLKLELNEFFRVHQFIRLGMAKLREQEQEKEQANTTIEN